MPDVAKALVDHSTAHRLRDRAIVACQRWLNDASASGELTGLDGEDFVLRFERSSLVFDSDSVAHPFVETRLGIHRHATAGGQDLCRVGHYRLITTIDGRDEDDYFVLEP